MTAVLFPDTVVRIVRRARKRAPCPTCGRLGRRHSVRRRQLRDLGLRGPEAVELVVSCHWCGSCRRHFMAAADDVCESGSQFTNGVKEKVLQSVYQDGLPVDAVVTRMLRDFHVHVPRSTLYAWLGLAGEKSVARRELLRLGA
jgi:hypothetical protein